VAATPAALDPERLTGGSAGSPLRGSGAGILFNLLLAPAGAFFLTALLVALVVRSFPAGVQAAVWALMASTLLTFTVFVLEEMRWYAIHEASLLDGDHGSVNLNGAIF
jgi:hypothetical protein